MTPSIAIGNIAATHAHAPAEGICLICSARVTTSEACCSKRCSWFAACRCPQCGRGRSPTYVYCSAVCSSQARQANWCVGCGVRQIACGGTSCGYGSCTHVPAVAKTRPPGSRRASVICRHELLAPQEKVRQSLTAQWAHASEGRLHVLAVIKVVSEPARRKAYLSYRSSVERAMSIHAQNNKYGFGGEGNEHRRFIPTHTTCSMWRGAAALEYCGHAPDVAAPCESCAVLQHGLSLTRLQRTSHFGAASCRAALPWCMPNVDGVRAMFVARVVVGATHCIATDAGADGAPFPAECHSSTVCDGNPESDCTYVFCDEAVDPQFLVLFH